MVGKNICEGDIALIEEKPFARDGELCCGIIDNKRSVLKLFYRGGAFVELRPANDDYEIIECPPTNRDNRRLSRTFATAFLMNGKSIIIVRAIFFT